MHRLDYIIGEVVYLWDTDLGMTKVQVMVITADGDVVVKYLDKPNRIEVITDTKFSELTIVL